MPKPWSRLAISTSIIAIVELNAAISSKRKKTAYRYEK
jgi:hypothetical protein